MKRFFFWLLGLPAGLVLVAFALANRKSVTISFDPVSPADPWFALDLPLWTVLFAGIFIGLLTGWIAAWLGQAKWRRAAQRADRELDQERAVRQSIENKLKSANIVPHHADG